MKPVFPRLPHADRHGAVMVATHSFGSYFVGTRVERGECCAADDPIVLAHPDAFRKFTPPPLDPSREK